MYQYAYLQFGAQAMYTPPEYLATQLEDTEHRADCVPTEAEQQVLFDGL